VRGVGCACGKRAAWGEPLGEMNGENDAFEWTVCMWWLNARSKAITKGLTLGFRLHCVWLYRTSCSSKLIRGNRLGSRWG
jgi:hypothetical protein